MLTPEVQYIRDGLSEPDQKIFDTLVSLAHEVNPCFQDKMQWRKPTFTLNDNWHHWIFNLSQTKMGMTITFHKGWLLADPHKILSGDGKHLRMIRFKNINEIQKNAIKELIRAAIKHQLDLEKGIEE